VTDAALVKIDVEPLTVTLPFGYKTQLRATGTYDNAMTQDVTTQVIWSSDQPSKASVSNNAGTQGLATGLSAATVTITATLQGVSGTATLTVTSETLSSITVTPDPLTLAIGQKQQMTATGTFSQGTVLDITAYVGWSSDHKRTASVSKTGLVTARKKGSALIKASKSGQQDTASVTVQ